MPTGPKKQWDSNIDVTRFIKPTSFYNIWFYKCNITYHGNALLFCKFDIVDWKPDQCDGWG